MQTTEASVRSSPIANIYAAIGERGENGRWTVRLYRHPLAVWIWLGAATMALGGAFSWSDGRLRAMLAPRAARNASPLTSPVGI
jgi:cytochrome c-type biogenesis protein CcmF